MTGALRGLNFSQRLENIVVVCFEGKERRFGYMALYS